jgi:RNA polymerase sigma-70 factor (ECF subfamily)
LTGLAELMGRVAEGDHAALRALYDETAMKLLGVVLRILPERGEAEDVVQDVFVTVWRKAGEYDPARAAPMTWLGTIARNRALDRVRARQIRAHDNLDSAYAVADQAPLPDAQAESSAAAQRLHAALDRLDPRHAAVIRATYVDGLTYEALAERENVPVGTLKTWVRRAVIRLRGEIAA